FSRPHLSPAAKGSASAGRPAARRAKTKRQLQAIHRRTSILSPFPIEIGVAAAVRVPPRSLLGGWVEDRRAAIESARWEGLYRNLSTRARLDELLARRGGRRCRAARGHPADPRAGVSPRFPRSADRWGTSVGEPFSSPYIVVTLSPWGTSA